MQLLIRLLLETGGAAPERPVQWRFSMMANNLLMMLSPVRSVASARSLAEHFMPLLLHQQEPQRTQATYYFIYVLNRGPFWATVSPSPPRMLLTSLKDVRLRIDSWIQEGCLKHNFWFRVCHYSHLLGKFSHCTSQQVCFRRFKFNVHFP